jgi:hypothetical protein
MTTGQGRELKKQPGGPSAPLRRPLREARQKQRRERAIDLRSRNATAQIDYWMKHLAFAGSRIALGATSRARREVNYDRRNIITRGAITLTGRAAIARLTPHPLSAIRRAVH